MTPDERAEIARSDDGRFGWVTVRVVTDGGSLRIGDEEGALVDLSASEARDLVWEDVR